jgi:hypothetical protein
MHRIFYFVETYVSIGCTFRMINKIKEIVRVLNQGSSYFSVRSNLVKLVSLNHEIKRRFIIFYFFGFTFLDLLIN